jgi:HSP20 family protein
MALMRTWMPYRTLAPFDEMQRLFEEVSRVFPGFAPARDGYETFPLDVAENDESYVVTAELPGIPQDKIDITIERNVLTIRGEKPEADRPEGWTVHRQERCFGPYQRSLVMPNDMNADKVQATFREGVLTVTVPKAEESKPRRIEIRTE